MRPASYSLHSSIVLSVLIFAFFGSTPPASCLPRSPPANSRIAQLTSNASERSLNRHVRVRRWYVPIINEINAPDATKSEEDSSSQDTVHEHSNVPVKRYTRDSSESESVELYPSFVEVRRRSLSGQPVLLAGVSAERFSEARRAITHHLARHSEAERAPSYGIPAQLWRSRRDRPLKQPKVHIYYGSVGKRR